ncbi:MAG TPA: hypothetical protein VH372_12035 [Actinospica sp.]|nr:hypothetical protein [Actinospica sp.]
MSDQKPDPGAPQSPPGPESEPGAANTEVFARAEFATGTAQAAEGDGRNAVSSPAFDASTPVPTQVKAHTQEQEQEREPEQQNAESGVAAAGPAAPGIATPETTDAPETVAVPGTAAAAEMSGAPAQGTQAPETSAAAPAPAPAYGYGYGYGGYGATPPTPQAWPTPEGPGEPAGKGRRAGWIVGLGVGYAVLAAGTAFGVIASKSPAAVDVTAVNASAYAAPVGSSGAAPPASASAKSSATAKASPDAAPTTAAPTTATPTSTVTGSVSGGVHHGDLRFFLLPPPQGASSVQGDPDGTTETIDGVVADYTDASQVKSSLREIGFKAACNRTYQDSSIGANVTIQLVQFGSSSASSEWLSSFSYSGAGYQSIPVSGESGAEGWSYDKDGTYELIGVYRDGDTFFQVDIYGAQSIPAADLGRVVSAEHARLANG